MPGGSAKYGAPVLTETAASIGGPFAPANSQLKATPVKTASYAPAAGELVPLDTTSATPIVITLPTAPADGTEIGTKWVLGSNATATVVTGGSDKFNTTTGGTSASLVVLNEQLNFIYAAAAAVWYVETNLSKGGLDTLYQPLDSDLTAIAALTTTSYGRGLLTSASQSALATLFAADAAFTATYQPLDSDLTAIAALTTTSYGRAFLALADAAAARTAIGSDTTYMPLPTALVSGRYYRVPNCTVTTSALQGNGNARAIRKFIPNAITAVRIGAEVSVIGDVGSHVRLGIWNDLNGRADSLVLDAGTIAGDSVAVQEITISKALTPGWYWFGGAVQDVTVTQPTVRAVSFPSEPSVVDATTSIPTSNLQTVGNFYSGATTAFTGSPTWGISTTFPVSIFIKVS